MKNLEISVSFLPDLNAVQCTKPFAEDVFYGPGHKKIGRVVFARALTGRSHVVIDENATGEEVQEIIKWVRGVLRKATS